jgi:hypothetical protein
MNIPALDAISEFLYQIASNPTVMTILLTLIIAITLGELFKRIFKSRILGFLVTTTALIWNYAAVDAIERAVAEILADLKEVKRVKS